MRQSTSAFRYTRPRLTQHLLTGGLLLLAIGLGSTELAATAWRWLTTTVPEWALLVLGPWVLHALIFWPVALAFHTVDRHDRPAFIARHRIQQGPPRRPALDKTLRNLAWNQLLWAPLMLVLLALGLKLRGWQLSPELPGLLQLLLELAGLAVAAVIVFYASHRFLHRRWWMKKVHRVHHEFRTTSALASEYAHPFEFCVANFLTLAAGVLLFAPSLPAIYLFTALSILTVLVHHSGYALPWAPWSVHHDWHHYRMIEAFGTVGVLDRVLGTSPELDVMEEEALGEAV